MHLIAFLLLLAPQPQDGQALYMTHCAACHGQTGNGQGTTELERPARSFKDGGFSFGNTREALFRTISTGIPGTQMPGFDEALAEDERRLVAVYVRTLGPPLVEASAEARIMTVKDQPLVVRGILPPIVAGAPLIPRGLLVGLPSGLTFEYRLNDFALLGVRQGAFVDRTDWTGRGGTPLKPLGRIILHEGGGMPPTEWWLPGVEASTPLRSRLVSSQVRDGVVSLERVLDGLTEGPVGMMEHLRHVHGSVASGISRTMTVLTSPPGVVLDQRVHSAEARSGADSGETSVYSFLSEKRSWACLRTPDGRVELFGVDRPAALELGPGSGLRILCPGRVVEPGRTLELLHLLAHEWSPEIQQAFCLEVDR